MEEIKMGNNESTKVEAKENKLSKPLEALLKKSKIKKKVFTYGEGEEALKVSVKQMLTLPERGEFEKDMLDILFDADDDTIESFKGYFYDFVFKYSVIAHYSDFPVDEFNAQQLWLIISNTKLFADIYNFANSDIDGIELSVRDAIRTRLECYAHKSDFGRFLSGLANAFTDMLEKVSEMNPDTIKQMVEKLGVKLPEGIDLQETINKYANILNN